MPDRSQLGRGPSHRAALAADYRDAPHRHVGALLSRLGLRQADSGERGLGFAFQFTTEAKLLDRRFDLFCRDLGRHIGHDGFLLLDGGFHFGDTFELAHGRTDRCFAARSRHAGDGKRRRHLSSLGSVVGQSQGHEDNQSPQ